MSNPSDSMIVRGRAVGIEWDGKVSARYFGKKVRQAEQGGAQAQPEPEAEPAPKAEPKSDEAAIRALWRQGKRKEALSYGKR